MDRGVGTRRLSGNAADAVAVHGDAGSAGAHPTLRPARPLRHAGGSDRRQHARGPHDEAGRARHGAGVRRHRREDGRRPRKLTEARVLKLHWFLPTGGDARDVLPGPDDPHRRAPSLAYLAQVATACDTLGFDGMLTPCGTGCEDAWLATAALIPLTRRVKFLVAFRPALLSPTLAAQMASTYQRVSGGRLLVNIVTGAEPAELARFGVWEDKETRYERTGEFVEIMRGAWSGEPFDFTGDHYNVAAATTRLPPSPVPRIYFGGASEAAERIAARHVDVYLAWGEPPEMVHERLTRMRALAADEGRTLAFGIRFHV